MSLLNLATALPAEPARKFALFGGMHLFILWSTLALPFALGRIVRRRESTLGRSVARTLAAILLGDRIFAWVLGVATHRITRWPDALPMHLCDWASFAVVIALLWRGQLVYELAYMWGLAGTFQAVLTPDLAEQFPSPFFISFFVDHCGIIISVLYLTWGLGMRPRPGTVWRVAAWNQVYLATAGLVDWTFHANYGYLAQKPAHSSLLDYFGPWPWYILSLEILAIVFFSVFYLPFWIGDRRRARRAQTDW